MACSPFNIKLEEFAIGVFNNIPCNDNCLTAPYWEWGHWYGNMFKEMITIHSNVVAGRNARHGAIPGELPLIVLKQAGKC